MVKAEGKLSLAGGRGPGVTYGHEEALPHHRFWVVGEVSRAQAGQAQYHATFLPGQEGTASGCISHFQRLRDRRGGHHSVLDVAVARSWKHTGLQPSNLGLWACSWAETPSHAPSEPRKVADTVSSCPGSSVQSQPRGLSRACSLSGRRAVGPGGPRFLSLPEGRAGAGRGGAAFLGDSDALQAWAPGTIFRPLSPFRHELAAEQVPWNYTLSLHLGLAPGWAEVTPSGSTCFCHPLSQQKAHSPLDQGHQDQTEQSLGTARAPCPLAAPSPVKEKHE